MADERLNIALNKLMDDGTKFDLAAMRVAVSESLGESGPQGQALVPQMDEMFSQMERMAEEVADACRREFSLSMSMDNENPAISPLLARAANDVARYAHQKTLRVAASVMLLSITQGGADNDERGTP